MKEENPPASSNTIVEKPATLTLGGGDGGSGKNPSPKPPSESPRRQTAASAALEAFLEEEKRPDDSNDSRSRLTPSDGVVVVSLFLPVLIRRNKTRREDWNIDWDLENLVSLQTPLRVTRVGLARVPEDTSSSEKMKLAAILRKSPWNCIAIFLDAETYDLYYHAFCKGVLWPVFHNSLDVYGEKATPSVEFDDAPFRSPLVGEGLVGVVASAERLDALVRNSQSQAGFSEVDDAESVQTVDDDDDEFAEVASARQSQQQRPRSVTFPADNAAIVDDNEFASGEVLQTRMNRVDRAWRAYKKVNQIFREHVVEAYNEGDLIWVHGFQLALLPAFVSRRLTVAKLGLFFHTPFPSSEIFRTLSMRNELLRGILSADQVGFHIFEYARHFLTTCRRLLGVRYEFDSRGPILTVDGREVVITVIHAGVEPADLADVASTPAGIRAVDQLRRELGLPEDDHSTRIIAGIDKLERLRGLPLKLLAYERFLDNNESKSEDKPRVVLVQYVLSSLERSSDCERTRRDTAIMVDKIREKHGDESIVWREVRELNIIDRLALLKLADVFWVSSVRDGLNRWPLEYVALQSDALLGTERHAAALARTPTSIASAPIAVHSSVAPYFDDVIERMIAACGGSGYPCEDPCTSFLPKRRFRRNRESGLVEEVDERYDDLNELADEIFPSLQAVADDEAESAKMEEWASTDLGKALVKRDDLDDGEDGDDYLYDNDGNKYFVTDLSRKILSSRSRSRLRDYLKSSEEAELAHANRNARCRSRRLGALLLSDNASATRVLLGSVSVNPWRIDDSATALANILDMNSRERMARHAKDAEFLARSTTARWTYRVLHDLKAMRKDDNRMNATHAGLGLNFRVLGMRSGFDALQVDRVAKAFRLAARRAEDPVKPQDPSADVVETTGHAGASSDVRPTRSPLASNSTPTRIIVLDYGGTLVPDAAAASLDSAAAYAIARGDRPSPQPSPEVINVLAALAADSRNIIFVISGRERHDLLESLGDVLQMSPNLGLCAEHGYFVRWPPALRPYAAATHGHGNKKYNVRQVVSKSHDDDADAAPTVVKERAMSSEMSSSGDQDEWESFDDTSTSQLGAWRAAVLTTMEVFAERTQGTYVEKHEASLVWQYRDADPDYGEMQAKELEHQLHDVLEPFESQAQVLRGENPSRGGYIEVRPAGVDKGAFLDRLLATLTAAGRSAEFALVVGDDESDEPMFSVLSAWMKQQQTAATPVGNKSSVINTNERVDSYFSVCIGKKPSEAEFYVDTHDDLIELLEALARVTSRVSRHISFVDLLYATPAQPMSVTSSDYSPATTVPEAQEDDERKRDVATMLSRSTSMPLMAQLQRQRSDALRTAHKVPSWMSFQQATGGKSFLVFLSLHLTVYFPQMNQARFQKNKTTRQRCSFRKGDSSLFLPAVSLYSQHYSPAFAYSSAAARSLPTTTNRPRPSLTAGC